jgi:hypothetical protein
MPHACSFVGGRALTRWVVWATTRQAEARLKQLQDELKRREDADRAKCRGVVPPSQSANPARQSSSTTSSTNPKPRSPATPQPSPPKSPKPPVSPKRTPRIEPVDDDEEEAAVQPSSSRPPVVAEVLDEATELKKAGNEALEEGDYELAAQLYTEALQDGAWPPHPRAPTRAACGAQQRGAPPLHGVRTGRPRWEATAATRFSL